MPTRRSTFSPGSRPSPSSAATSSAARAATGISRQRLPRRPARCARTTKTPSPPSSADRSREHDTMEWDFTTQDVVKGHADYTLHDFRSGLVEEVRSNLGPMDEAQL